MNDTPGLEESEESENGQMNDAPGLEEGEDSQMNDAPGLEEGEDSQMNDAPGLEESEDSQMNDAPGLEESEESEESEMDDTPAPGLEDSEESEMDDTPAPLPQRTSSQAAKSREAKTRAGLRLKDAPGSTVAGKVKNSGLARHLQKKTPMLHQHDIVTYHIPLLNY